MGAACMIGLGLALARPDKRVLVVTGDGELLMNLGALATIAGDDQDALVRPRERESRPIMQAAPMARGNGRSPSPVTAPTSQAVPPSPGR